MATLREIIDYWGTGGPLMVPLAGACFAIWYVFLRTRRSLLWILDVPDGFEATLVTDFRGRSPGANIPVYSGMPGVLPAAVVCVLRAVHRHGHPGIAFEQYQDEQIMRIERETVVLSALTIAAPLLGLLGTVVGMVTTFRGVSGPLGQAATQVSTGISQALITTQFGLVAAIPGLFGLARLQRLLDQVNVRFAACKTHILLGLEADNREPDSPGSTPGNRCPVDVRPP